MRKPGSVWCTTATQVELVRDGVAEALHREGDWWVPERPLAHGERYAFRLDGGSPIPDPRSPSQPDGVFGPSEHVDASRFVWRDEGFRPAPLADAVLYELHVGTFSAEGTFDGVVARLDELVGLGVTHLELMPVGAFPGARGWGYDGVALFAPYAGYGGPTGLQRLVDACHRRGLGVILDVVYNHLGPEGNQLAQLAPYFSWRHRTPWGPGFNLDEAHADEVRAFLCDNVAHWIAGFHVDGLRLDATHALLDTSATHLLEAIADRAREAGGARGVEPLLIAEHLENDPAITRSRERFGRGLDAQWSDDFHHALHAWLTGERRGGLVDFGTVEELARCLEGGWHLDGRPSAYRRRTVGRAWDVAQPRTRLVAYAQNHDQVGNRAQGERLVALVGEARAHVAAALLLLGPATPMLFMGEEWGAAAPFQFFADFEDRRLMRDVERGRRRELAARGYVDPPAPGDPATFQRSRLPWPRDESALWRWHHDLIALRRSRPELRDGGAPTVRRGHDWLAMQRGAVVVAANLGPPRDLPVEGHLCLAYRAVGTRVETDGVGVWVDAQLG